MYFRKYVALGLAILFALSVLVLVLRLARPAATKSVFGRKGTCPDCGQPLLSDGARCSYCVYLKRTREMSGTGGGSPPQHELSPVGKLAIVAGILGLLTGLAFYPELRQLRVGWAAAKAESLVVRCKGCKRKLRCPASNAGKLGACPSCRASLTFPGGDGVAVAEPAT